MKQQINCFFFFWPQCKDFEKVGATIAVTPCDVVEEADITFSCVADPQAAKEVNLLCKLIIIIKKYYTLIF